LAVNVSSLTVTDPAWLRTLVSLIKGRSDVAKRLTIEITETAALEDFDVTARFVSSVRDLGCKVALRGGPVRLDSLAALLSWSRFIVMPPVR
jgi:EAL domain-containing protein (putative c-di-GMP-specific phosphodiesterase class I)